MAKKLPCNPWIEVWTQPRRTLRAIVECNPRYGFVILSAIYGLPMLCGAVQGMSLPNVLPLWAIVIAIFIVCTFLSRSWSMLGSIVFRNASRTC